MSDAKIKLDLNEKPENTVRLRPLGISPYFLVEINEATEEELGLSVEVGGGVNLHPADELASFLEFLAEAIKDSADSIRQAQEALDDEDDEDDEDEA